MNLKKPIAWKTLIMTAVLVGTLTIAACAQPAPAPSPEPTPTPTPTPAPSPTPTPSPSPSPSPSPTPSPTPSPEPTPEALPGEGVEVRPATDTILEDQFPVRIVEIGLEELGYDVQERLELNITTAHVAVGQGEADIYPIHWNPLQNNIYKEAGGDEKMERIGAIYDGAVQGYLIDKKTADEYNITNLEQLKDPEIAALFDTDGDGKANLAGCNPGWGCELAIEHHMDAYELREWVNHQSGSYFAIIADVIARYKNGEPILYYTWTPLWLSSILVPGEDVVWLEVPFTSLAEGDPEKIDTTLPDGRNVGFSVNKSQVAANKEFIEANPAARAFFEQVHVPIQDINDQNLKVRNGEDTEEDIMRHAREWIADHQEEFDTWIENAKQAAQ